MAKFDPVLRGHVSLINSGVGRITYSGKEIQNGLISCVSDQTLEKMEAEIEDSCAPTATETKEHSSGFLAAAESAGLHRSTPAARPIHRPALNWSASRVRNSCPTPGNVLPPNKRTHFLKLIAISNNNIRLQVLATKLLIKTSHSM